MHARDVMHARYGEFNSKLNETSFEQKAVREFSPESS